MTSQNEPPVPERPPNTIDWGRWAADPRDSAMLRRRVSYTWRTGSGVSGRWHWEYLPESERRRGAPHGEGTWRGP